MRMQARTIGVAGAHRRPRLSSPERARLALEILATYAQSRRALRKEPIAAVVSKLRAEFPADPAPVLTRRMSSIVESSPSPKKTKKERSRCLADVDLDKIQLQLFTVLKREAGALMDLSFRKKLDAIASKTLVNYLKLLKTIKTFRLL